MHKTMIHAIGAIAIGVLAVASNAPTADAAVIYPWCAHYGGRNMGGAPSCGFTSFAQCMATVSGTQGTCEMNPWYEPRQQPARPQRRRAPGY